MERFIRPMGLRLKKANVTHRELAVTVQCPIIGVKGNPPTIPCVLSLAYLREGYHLSRYDLADS
jgi:ribosome biogenesis protein NSA2